MSDPALRALATVSRAAGEQAVFSAMSQLRVLIPVVARNNPTKTLTWILNRSDVASLVRITLADMVTKGANAIQNAYQAGIQAGQVAAHTTLMGAGTPPQEISVADSDYLKALVDRWKESSQAVFQALPGQMAIAFKNVQLRPGLKDDPQNGVPNVTAALGTDREAALGEVISKATRDLTFRAGIGASTAAVRGHADAQDAAAPEADDVGIRWMKRWKIFDSPDHTVCIYCRQLNGVSVAVGLPFPIVGGPTAPKVFGGKLMAPPRHPNCMCSLELFQETLASHVEQATLQFPDKEPEDNSKPAAPPIPELAVTKQITAQQIRDWPRKTYRSILSSLLKTIAKYFGKDHHYG